VPLQLAELEEVFGAQITTDEQVEWDERTAAVQALRTRRYGSLIIETRTLQAVPPELATDAMLAGVRQLGIAALPWDTELRNLQARLEFVRRLERAPGGPWPASDDATLLDTLNQWLPPWIEGMTRRDHLARVPLAEILLARLSGTQRRLLEELAPARTRRTSGSRIRGLDRAACHRRAPAGGLQGIHPRIGGGRCPSPSAASPARRPCNHA
jgi:ATP-dependent helicase HrpB